jgi:hypothetical protein
METPPTLASNSVGGVFWHSVFIFLSKRGLDRFIFHGNSDWREQVPGSAIRGKAGLSLIATPSGFSQPVALYHLERSYVTQNVMKIGKN